MTWKKTCFVVLMITGFVMSVTAAPILNPSSPGTLLEVIVSKVQDVLKGDTGETGPVGSMNMTMNQTVNLTPGPVADLSGYYPLNGTKLLTGRLDAGFWNLSNITMGALSDAANWSFVERVNTSMKGYVDTRPIINGSYLTGVDLSWNTSYDTIANVSLTNIAINNTIVSLINSNNATLKDHGNLSGLADDDHARYFDKDTSKAFTGGGLKREVANSFLAVYGGTGGSGAGAWYYVTGKTHASNPGSFFLYVPNAAKNADINVMRVDGATDTPYLSLQSHLISNVLDPVSAQDAATRNYVLHPDLTASAQLNAVCYNTGTKLVTYNSGLTTCLASTEKVKENIIPVSESLLPKLNELKPVYYTSKLDNQIHYGLIGEEVAQIYPELVGRDEKGEITGIRYEEFTAVLLKGMQEQQATINKQDERIRALEKKVGL